MLSASRFMGVARRGLAPGARAMQAQQGLARVQLPTALPVPAVVARASFLGPTQTRFFLASPAWRVGGSSTSRSSANSAATWTRLRASSSKAGVESATRREQVMAKSKPHWERLKDLWRKYGVVAIGTYLSLYGVVLGSIYVAISQGWVRTKKRSSSNDQGSDEDFNLVTTTNKFVTLAENLGVAKYMELEHVSSKTGTFLLAWVATKFTEPLRLALTLAITPRIARLVGRAPKLPTKALKAAQTKAKTQKQKPQHAEHNEARGPPPRGPPPGQPPGYPQARGPSPGHAPPRGPPPGAPPGRGPPPGAPPGRPPPGAPPGRGPPPGAPPGRGPPPGPPPGRGPPPGAPPGRGPPPGPPPGRGPPPGAPPGAPPGRGPPPGAPPGALPGRGPPPGAAPGRGPPPGVPPPGQGPPPGLPPGAPPGGRGPPPGAAPPGRGPPPGAPPPGAQAPPGAIPGGGPPRGPPPGAPPGFRGAPPPGGPPGQAQAMARGPPPGMPPRGPPPGMAPRGPPGASPGMPPRGPPGASPGMPPRGPPGAPPGLPPRGMPGAPPGMPPRGPPGAPPPGMPPRGPPGMQGAPPRGPPPGFPPSRGPPGMPPGARPPPPTMPTESLPGAVADAPDETRPGLPRGPPGMPPRGPPGAPPPGMLPRGPPPGMPPRGPPPGMPPRGPPGAPSSGPGAPAGGAFASRFGKLEIKVLRAFDLKKLGMLDTADPYVKLTIGAQNVQTKVHESGGKTPEFNESFDFSISTEKELVVEVWDQEKNGQDRFMAQAKTDIVTWLAKGGFEGDVELQDREGKPAGKLAVVAKFSKPEPGAGAGAAAGGQVKAPPMAPPVLSGPAVAPLPPGANAISVPGAPPVAPSEPPRDPNGKFTDKEILEAFQAFDLDHNNYVGAAEIRHVLINIGESPTDEEVDEMIKMVDKDGDGQVSFDEFYAMVTKGKQPPPGLGVTTSSPEKAAGGPSPAASGAQAIQLRNQRKVALEEFARDNGIKPESVKKAYKRFQATDKDGSGQIDYSEFCEVMQVDPSPQCEKVFQLFDNDKTGRIDVREFMIALSNFSGAEKEEKLKFAFLVFDEDGNGVITRQELMKILKANHMASSEAEVARKADTIMSQGDKDGDGVISFDEFSVVSKKFPNILFPAYTLGTTKD